MGLLTKAADMLYSAVSGPEAVGPDTAIQTFIDSFWQHNPSFHCLVLAVPPGSGAAGSDIAEAAAGMLAHFGASRALSGPNCLALIPGDMDRELFSHRFLQSINAQTIFHCGAASSAEAVQALSPYL
jgi:hypothetical protein